MKDTEGDPGESGYSPWALGVQTWAGQHPAPSVVVIFILWLPQGVRGGVIGLVGLSVSQVEVELKRLLFGCQGNLGAEAVRLF